MIIEKLSPLVQKQISVHHKTEKIRVFLWINEDKKDTLIQYGIEHRVPGFLVLTDLSIEKLNRMTHEDWLMLVTMGPDINDTRRDPALS